jgi:hypothetical protein
MSGALKVEVFNGSTFFNDMISGAAPTKIISDFDPLGNAAIAAAINGSGTITLMRFMGSAFSQTSTSMGVGALEFDVAVKGDGDFLIATTNGSKQMYLSFGNTSSGSANVAVAPTPVSFGDPYLALINELEVTADNQGYFRITMIGTDSTTLNYKIATCTVSINAPTCIPTDMVAANSVVLNHLTSATTDYGGTIQVSAHRQSLSNEINVTINSSANTFTLTTLTTPTMRNIQNPMNYSMTSFTPPGSPTIVYPKFAPPVLSGFKMNFMSLNPSSFLSLFTLNQTEFEAVGSNL